ncbi:hypothetical protein QFC21_003200 [Naganishia friedmannii]|uniref:Uncharacterized protein n=1 Tax=Naganishia friedmannii TaxID=89922 RepID=A0ACC2VR09_9TREE|nr:hypothetical protein QFC21_003200 [Naganishia friedmannii]
MFAVQDEVEEAELKTSTGTAWCIGRNMSTPPVSAPLETPLPFTPAETATSITPTPSTVAFRATVPQLLKPLAPELSALYTARLRLLVDLPVGSSRGWCCTQCGWLREEYGWKVVKVKQERGKMKADTAVAPIKKGKARGKGKGKAAIEDTVTDIPMPSDTITLSDSTAPPQPSPSSSKIGTGARVPSTTTTSKNRTKYICHLCGSTITLRPPSAVTKAGYLSARRTKAIVAANDGDLSVLPAVNGITSIAGTKRTRASMRQEEAGSLQSTNNLSLVPPATYNPSSSSSSSSPKTTTSGKPLIPNPIKASPSLAFIPLTDPQPSTEPLPALSPSTLPPAGKDRPAGVRNAVGFVNLGPVGGSVGKGKGKALAMPMAGGAGKLGWQRSGLKTSVVSSQLPSAGVSSQPSSTTTPPPRPPASRKPSPSIITAAAKPKPTLPTAAAAAALPPPKKKQKTGLAKLLADNKAREKESAEKKKAAGGLLSLDGADWEL